MLNFLIVANDPYIKYAKSLIYSIDKYHKNYQIFLYLINPTPKSIKLLSKKNKYSLNIRIIKKDLNQKIIDIYSEEAAYSANIRGKLLKELVETEELDNLTYIDADSLIRGPIEFHTNYDLMFFVRPKKDNRKKTFYFSGLISVNINQSNKEKVLKALNYFQERIDEYGLLKWFSDQNAIEDLYYYMIDNDIKFKPLLEKYFDWGYHKDSKIWMGKGKSKSNNEYMTNQALYEGLF